MLLKEPIKYCRGKFTVWAIQSVSYSVDQSINQSINQPMSQDTFSIASYVMRNCSHNQYFSGKSSIIAVQESSRSRYLQVHQKQNNIITVTTSSFCRNSTFYTLEVILYYLHYILVNKNQNTM